MDTNRLQKIFDSYVEKYDTFNNTEHHELYKWAAVSHFQKYWDLDAENFGEMFKTSFEESESLIDASASQPVIGVVSLCRQSDETMEEVRTLFRALFAADQSDYAVRQQKAETFVREMNALLREKLPQKWKYHQDISSALMYLSFADPDDNFMYKETEARSFADYIEYREEISDDEHFSLPAYYRMCEAVASELQQQTDLLQTVADALSAEADSAEDSSMTEVDGENHILVFDIIYVAQNYDLYEGETVRKSSRKTTAEDNERAMEAARLQEQMAALQEELGATEASLKVLTYPALEGQTVRHRLFKEGTVTAQDGKYITISFAAGQKRFVLPDAVTGGFITIASEEAQSLCQKMAEAKQKRESLQREIGLLKLQMQDA